MNRPNRGNAILRRVWAEADAADREKLREAAIQRLLEAVKDLHVLAHGKGGTHEQSPAGK